MTARICAAPRCPNIQPCARHARKPFATARRSTSLYETPAWRQRRKAQLAAEPYCRWCMATGHVVRASVADHIEPHNGDPVRFMQGALQSLCWPHSNVKTGRETRVRAKVAAR